MVAEDDEREMRSREEGSRGLRSRERVGAAASASTAAASPERYGGRFASDGDENWGHVTAHVGMEAETHPQRSTGSRAFAEGKMLRKLPMTSLMNKSPVVGMFLPEAYWLMNQ